jgi:hypothetical protein
VRRAHAEALARHAPRHTARTRTAHYARASGGSPAGGGGTAAGG